MAHARFYLGPKCDLAPGPKVIQVFTPIGLWAVLQLGNGPKDDFARGPNAIWL